MELYPCDERCYRCKAQTWECIGEYVPHRGPPEDVIECAFCGVRLRVHARRKETAVPVATKRTADSENFRFQYGRFKGKTLAETDAEPNGRRYLEVMQGRSEKLKGIITDYLASHAAPSA